MNQIQMDPGIKSPLPEKNKSQGGTEDHLMQVASSPIRLEDSSLGVEKQTDNITMYGEETEVAGKKEERGKGGEIGFQRREAQQTMNFENEEMGNKWENWEMGNYRVSAKGKWDCRSDGVRSQS